MNTNPKTILSMAIAILAVTAVVTTSALAENQKTTKKTASHSVAATAAAEVGGMPESVSSTTGQHDRKAGPAWRTIGGTVKQIKDNTYTVEDYEGNQVQLVVGQDTKHLRQKRVGDTVRAEITRGGFANSIQ